MRAIIGKPLDLSFIPGWPSHKYVWPIIPEDDSPVLFLTFDLDRYSILWSIRETWKMWPVYKRWMCSEQDAKINISKLAEVLGYDIDWTVTDGSL